MFFWYKNSFLASVVSIAGCGIAMCGIANFESDAGAGILLILLGVGIAIWGKIISNNKAFKKWWKQVKDNNLETAVATDLNTAIAVYNKNPQKRTIKKIATLNPKFAEYIQQNIANKS
jgi:hypothetical protein